MPARDENNRPVPAGEPHGNLSRRRFLQGTALTLGGALASAGIYYELIDTIACPPVRAAFAASQPMQEQYILQNEQVIEVNGTGVESSAGKRSASTIAVRVPALHDHVITATVKVPANTKALQEAQQHLESVLLGLEQQLSPTPAGLGIAIAWGLPYFHHYIPSLGKTSPFFPAGTRYPAYLPVDTVTSKLEGHTVYALQEAMTFPSDQPPAGFGPVQLEQNDVAVLLRSDSLSNIMAGTNALFGTASNQAGRLFTVTSMRHGFSGGGFSGQQSLPSRLALAANLPGARSIPPQAQAFLGFTTTLQDNMGPGIIASLETLPGVTDQWPHGYFRQGTTMHLSHLFEDLATWYSSGTGGGGGRGGGGGDGRGTFPTYADRVQAMLQPDLSPAPAPGTLTLDPPGQSEADVAHGVHQYHAYGHSGSMAQVDSTTSATTSNYGVTYSTGTTIPVRGDFNTLDNPFYYTAEPTADHYSSTPAAGLHFIVFQPTSALFNRVRLAMDGHYADQTLPIAPRSPHAGINAVLFTTHRQNYLVPPRRHRAFPLAEYLA